MRPRIAAIDVADPPAAWAALGFERAGDTIWIDGVAIRLGGEGEGITGWELGPWPDPPPGPAPAHPNGITGIDHLVLASGDWDATLTRLAGEGIEITREAARRGLRQGFVRLGSVILEIVCKDDIPAPDRFWGITLVADDLDALAERLGERLGGVRDAVQPGRQIATLRPDAGLSPAVAFMTPEPD